MSSVRTASLRFGPSAIFATSVLTEAKTGSRWRRSFRCAAWALLLLLASGLAWAETSTTFNGVINTLPTGSVTLTTPYGMAMDASGNLYISSGGSSGQVAEVTAAGVASVLAFTSLSPTLNNPRGMAVDGSGNLYVADSSNDRIVELSSAGVASVVNTGNLLASPYGVALDAAGDLYVSDSEHSYIVEVPAGGGTAVTLAISGLVTALNNPAGLTFDVSGNLYIADSGNNRIVKVTPDRVGSVLSISGDITLSSPAGVTVDGLGKVYIADYSNNRIVTVTSAGVGAVLNTGAITLSGPRSVVVGVWGAVYITDSGDNRVVEAQLTSVGFPHLTEVFSENSFVLPFTVGSGVTLGSVAIQSDGTFVAAFSPPTTCIPGTTNQSCAVSVIFQPYTGGLFTGAVVLFDNSTPAVPLLTIPLYGFFDGPQATFSPGPSGILHTGELLTSDPVQIVSAEYLYIANSGGKNVVESSFFGSSIVSTGAVVLGGVGGVAVDGAGNLYIADPINSDIVEVTQAGLSSVLSISGTSLGSPLSQPAGLAVDATGNLYIADQGNNRVVKVTPSGMGSVLATGSLTLGPGGVSGVAVDGEGTVYIADSQNNRIIKVTALGVASLLVPVGITPVLSFPKGVSVDGMGNVYVADTGNNRVVQVTKAGVASVVQFLGLTTPATLSGPNGVAVDSSGNIYVADSLNNRVAYANVSQTPPLAFPNTGVGSASASQAVTVTNIGDQPLAFLANPIYTTNFSEPAGASNQCLISTPIMPGTFCEVSVQFTPQSLGPLSASISLVTNNLGNSDGFTNFLSVTGTGAVSGDTTAVVVSANPTAANVGQPIVVTAVVSDTAAGKTAIVPTGGVTFMDTIGSITISLNGGLAVTLNGAGVATLTGVTLNGAGLHTITANYAGVSGTFAASTNTLTLMVSADTPVMAGPATEPVQVANGQAGAVPVMITGPYGVGTVPVPTGTLSYNVLNSSSTSIATGTATLTPGTTNSTATVPIASSLAPGSYTVNVTYGGDSNYAAITTPVIIQVVVSPIVPTISWAQPLPIAYGTTLSGILNATAASGDTTVAGTFAYTATPAGGSTSPVTNATVLGAGSYTLTANFTPAVPSAYGSASANVALTVSKATPTIALTSSANTTLVMSPVTFTATVASSIGTPSGPVNFFSGTTLLGSGTLALGAATYTTSSLPVGELSITAVYAGDSNFLTLTSSALTETIMASYTITAPTTPVTVEPGGSVTVNITVPPLGGAFAGTVTLTATGLPAGATATFNPPTVIPGIAGASSVMTIQLSATTANILFPDGKIPDGHRRLPLASFGLVFAVFGIVFGRKHLPRALVLMVLLSGSGAGTMFLTACGTTTHKTSQAGSYTMTVTGTSGAIQNSTTVMLVVE